MDLKNLKEFKEYTRIKKLMSENGCSAGMRPCIHLY